jgi:hypothetical protein
MTVMRPKCVVENSHGTNNIYETVHRNPYNSCTNNMKHYKKEGKHIGEFCPYEAKLTRPLRWDLTHKKDLRS